MITATVLGNSKPCTSTKTQVLGIRLGHVHSKVCTVIGNPTAVDATRIV